MDAAVQLLSALGAPTGAGAAAKPEAATAPPASPAPATPAPPAAAPPAAPAAPAKPPEPSRAGKFADLTKKERALLDQQRALKAQAQQLEQMKADLDARMKAVGETEAQRKARRAEYARNPQLALQDMGLTLEQLAEAVLRDGQPDPALLAQSLEERLKDVDRRVEERLSAREAADKEREERAAEAAREAAQREQEEAVAQVRADIAEVVKAEPEKYEMITVFGADAQRLVYNAIEAHYKETGQVLSYRDACDKVEAYLDGEIENKVAKTKRYGSRFKPKEDPKPPAGAPPAAPSASLGQVGAPPTPPVRKLVTEEERMAAAEAALRASKF